MAEIQRDTQGSREDTLRFLGVVNLFSSWAMIGLGKLADPATGKAQKNLDVARQFIDTLEMLEHKTKGNLVSDEAKVLQTTLTDLRMMFIEESKATTPEPPKEAPKPEEPKTGESKVKFQKKYE